MAELYIWFDALLYISHLLPFSVFLVCISFSPSFLFSFPCFSTSLYFFLPLSFYTLVSHLSCFLSFLLCFFLYSFLSFSFFASFIVFLSFFTVSSSASHLFFLSLFFPLSFLLFTTLFPFFRCFFPSLFLSIVSLTTVYLFFLSLPISSFTLLLFSSLLSFSPLPFIPSFDPSLPSLPLSFSPPLTVFYASSLFPLSNVLCSCAGDVLPGGAPDDPPESRSPKHSDEV